MKTIPIIYIIIYLTVSSFAQVPTIQWERTYGGTSADIGYSICKTTDGGYMIVSATTSTDGDVSFNHSIPGVEDVWMIKIDSTGSLIWEKSYGGTGDEWPNKIYQTYDNGFVFFGTTGSPDGDVLGLHVDPNFPSPHLDGWLLKTDSMGTIEWQHCYGGTYDDYGRDVIITPDSNYLFAEDVGSDNGDISNSLGPADYWLVKVNQSGGIIWEKTFGGGGYDNPTCCSISSEGGYYIAGYSNHDFGGFHVSNHASDIGIVRVNSIGDFEWSKSHGGLGLEDPYSIIPCENNGYFMVSEISDSGGDITQFYGASDLWIFKADSNGVILWEKSYGGSSYDRPSQIIKSKDGGLIIAGYTASNDHWVSNNHGWEDFWIFKLDSLGNMEWEKSLGGTDDDRAYSVLETQDGGCIVCGYTKSNNGDVTANHGNEDVWVVKLSPPTLGIQTPENQFADFTAFQNDDQLIIRFFSKHSGTSQITFSNKLGKNILEKEINFREGINYAYINLPALAEGMYFINAEGNGIGKGKIFIK